MKEKSKNIICWLLYCGLLIGIFVVWVVVFISVGKLKNEKEQLQCFLNLPEKRFVEEELEEFLVSGDVEVERRDDNFRVELDSCYIYVIVDGHQRFIIRYDIKDGGLYGETKWVFGNARYMGEVEGSKYGFS